LAPLVKGPDLIVHVDASVLSMHRRIAVRGREFERALTPELLRTIRLAYRELAVKFRCPVIAVDGDLRDFRRVGKADPLVAEIRAAL